MSSTDERVEKGREILKSRAAQGEPGTKQPAPSDPVVTAQETVDEIKRLQEEFQAETRGPSAGDTKNNPVPPAERTRGPNLDAAATAAGALGTARSQIENQLVSDARLHSDPRYERDQKIYDMGQRGDLAFVPPAPEETAMAAARAGVPESVIDKIPKTASEEADRDEARLAEGEKAAAEAKTGQLPPGAQEVDSQPRPPQKEEETDASVKHVVR